MTFSIAGPIGVTHSNVQLLLRRVDNIRFHLHQIDNKSSGATEAMLSPSFRFLTKINAKCQGLLEYFLGHITYQNEDPVNHKDPTYFE